MEAYENLTRFSRRLRIGDDTFRGLLYCGVDAGDVAVVCLTRASTAR